MYDLFFISKLFIKQAQFSRYVLDPTAISYINSFHPSASLSDRRPIAFILHKLAYLFKYLKFKHFIRYYKENVLLLEYGMTAEDFNLPPNITQEDYNYISDNLSLLANEVLSYIIENNNIFSEYTGDVNKLLSNIENIKQISNKIFNEIIRQFKVSQFENYETFINKINSLKRNLEQDLDLALNNIRSLKQFIKETPNLQRQSEIVIDENVNKKYNENDKQNIGNIDLDIYNTFNLYGRNDENAKKLTIKIINNFIKIFEILGFNSVSSILKYLKSDLEDNKKYVKNYVDYEFRSESGITTYFVQIIHFINDDYKKDKLIESHNIFWNNFKTFIYNIFYKDYSKYFDRINIEFANIIEKLNSHA